MSACETAAGRAIVRLGANDATLRAVHVSFSALAEPEYVAARLAGALFYSRAPLASISLCELPVCAFYATMRFFDVPRPALYVFRLCRYAGSSFSLVMLADALLGQPAPLRIIVSGPRYSDFAVRTFAASFQVSDEQAAILSVVGQYAAQTLRPMIAPVVHCARSSECVCAAENEIS
jgi:hypothetical protein